MELNPKDLAMMYSLGLVIFVLLGFVSMALSSGPQLLQITWMDYARGIICAFLLFGIPLAFYFYRNRCDAGCAAIISFVFGITLVPVIFAILFLVELAVLMVSGIGKPDFVGALLAQNWFSVLFELAAFGFFGTVSGVAVYLAVDRLIHAKKVN